MPGARAVSFINDTTVILPPELSLDMEAITTVTEWLQGRLRVEGISLKRSISQTLLADGVWPKHLTGEKRTTTDDTDLTVVQQGMRVVGVPNGTENFKRDFLQDVVNGEPDELVRALVPRDDTQASFWILGLPASLPSHLVSTVPHSITHHSAADYDAWLE